MQTYKDTKGSQCPHATRNTQAKCAKPALLFLELQRTMKSLSFVVLLFALCCYLVVLASDRENQSDELWRNKSSTS